MFLPSPMPVTEPFSQLGFRATRTQALTAQLVLEALHCHHGCLEFGLVICSALALLLLCVAAIASEFPWRKSTLRVDPLTAGTLLPERGHSHVCKVLVLLSLACSADLSGILGRMDSIQLPWRQLA